jgi:hypothetical protein
LQKKIFNIWIPLVASALLTGIICYGFFSLIYLLLGTVIAMGLIVAAVMIDLFDKSPKGIRITGFIFIFFLIATLTSLIGMKISENRATRLADKVIVALYDYKNQVGHFPKEINQLSLDDETKSTFSKGQHYRTDATMRKFEISAWSDGLSVKIFRSWDSAWVLDD